VDVRTFRELIPPVLLAAAWVANGCGASQPSTKPTVKEETKPVAQAKTSDCVGGEMTIEIEAAEEGEAAATLEIDRGNPIMLGRDAQRAPSNDPFDATCLRTNDGERRIPPRTKVTVPIAASQTELAKIRIGDKLLLVEATARTRLRITDNPCFFWELQSTDIDPWSELPPQATCEDVERECPPGYDRVAGPGREGCDRHDCGPADVSRREELRVRGDRDRWEEGDARAERRVALGRQRRRRRGRRRNVRRALTQRLPEASQTRGLTGSAIDASHTRLRPCDFAR
jgi:hypothetical protein